MAVAVTVASLGNEAHRELVDLPADDAGTDCRRAGLVRAPDDVVDLALLGTRLAHAHGARHVGVVVVVQGAVVHDDHVALFDDALTGLGVRVGAVGAGGDDGAKREAVCPVREHVVLELDANLLLGEAGMDVAADVLESLVRDALCLAEQGKLLGILDHAQVADVAVQAWQLYRIHRPLDQLVEEGDGGRVLDGDRTRARVGDARGRPLGMPHHVLVDVPDRVPAQALAEGVEVAGVGVQPLALGRDEGRVRGLVVEGALGPGEPAQVGIVAQDHGIVAAVCHKAAQGCEPPLESLVHVHDVPPVIVRDESSVPSVPKWDKSSVQSVPKWDKSSGLGVPLEEGAASRAERREVVDQHVVGDRGQAHLAHAQGHRQQEAVGVLEPLLAQLVGKLGRIEVAGNLVQAQTVEQRILGEDHVDVEALLEADGQAARKAHALREQGGGSGSGNEARHHGSKLGAVAQALPYGNGR